MECFRPEVTYEEYAASLAKSNIDGVEVTYEEGENIDDSVLAEIELANKQLISEQESCSR